MEETTSQKFDYDDSQKRSRNALNISIVTAIMLTLTLITVLLIGGTSSINMISLVTLLLSIITCGLSMWLSRRNSDLGMGILITALIITSACNILVEKGQAIPTGIANIIVVSGIATFSLSQKWIPRAIIASFIAALTTIILDQYTTGTPVSPNPEVSTIISLAWGLVYLFVIATQFNNFTLRIKLIIGFLFLTTLSLTILGWQSNSTIRNILVGQIKTNILESSISISTDYQNFVDSELNTIQGQAQLPQIVEYMTLPQSKRLGSQNERSVIEKLNSLKKDSPAHILSYALLDKNGINILDTNSANVGTSFAEQDFFKYITTNKKAYSSGLVLTPQPDTRIIYFASPITSTSGDLLGILSVAYNADFLQSTMDAIIDKRPMATIGEYSYLIDGNKFFILGHSTRPNLLFKTYLDKNDDRLTALQEQGLISSENLNSISLPQPEIVAKLSKMKSIAAFRAPSQENKGGLAEASAIRIANSNWIVVTAQPISTISTTIQNQTRSTVIIGLMITLLAAVIAIVLSNILTRPLLQLTDVAELVSTGKFTQKAKINTKDEIGALSASFNRMTDELNQTFNSLEVRVAERTTDLEIARQQSEKRAGELQSIGEISKVITGEQKLETLLPLISRLVSERFGYYHTGIFLIDETKQFAVLQAANSEGGKNMLARGHKLEVGGSGIVGYVAKFGTPRIALDVGLDAVFFENPDLPNTRSEMALPLKVRDQTIGVLDVQSEKPGAFTENDANTLSILADQIAIALENARLFTQTQQALSEAQALYRQNSQEGWLTFGREGASVGYQQGLKGGRKLTTPVETDEIRQAMNRGNILVFNTDGVAKESSIVVPIKLRGQVIGALNIKAPTKDRRWSDDEVNLAEAISERLSLALENARLIQESQRQVIKEQTISEVTGKIGASINLKNVLQTAVEELGRAMPGSDVMIQFKSDGK